MSIPKHLFPQALHSKAQWPILRTCKILNNDIDIFYANVNQYNQLYKCRFDGVIHTCTQNEKTETARVQVFANCVNKLLSFCMPALHMSILPMD